MPDLDGYDQADLEDGWDGDDAACTWCDGEPWDQECADPLQCGCSGFHCPACANTGLAKYQTVW